MNKKFYLKNEDDNKYHIVYDKNEEEAKTRLSLTLLSEKNLNLLNECVRVFTADCYIVLETIRSYLIIVTKKEYDDNLEKNIGVKNEK